MNRKYVTTLGCILMALFAMNLTIISPLIMEIGKTFSLSITQSGLIFTFNFIGFVVFILIGGALADRFGKKPVLNVAIIGATISILGFAAVQNFTVMCAAAILMGGFGGVLESIVSALISDINPENPGPGVFWNRSNCRPSDSRLCHIQRSELEGMLSGTGCLIYYHVGNLSPSKGTNGKFR